MLPLTSV